MVKLAVAWREAGLGRPCPWKMQVTFKGPIGALRRGMGAARDQVRAAGRRPDRLPRHSAKDRLTLSIAREASATPTSSEVDVGNGDVGGIGVHIAVRVMAAARPGEILVSRTVRATWSSGPTREDRHPEGGS
jgi:class 3 adenylate cyclase